MSYLLLEELGMCLGVFVVTYLIVHGRNNMKKDSPWKWRDAWTPVSHSARKKERVSIGLTMRTPANAILRPRSG
jgi:hypothetical protein